MSSSIRVEPALAVEDLSHKYYANWAVSNISFSISQNGIYGLLGANGAGKSTTLNSLCGVLTPTEGKVSLLGFDILRDPMAAKQRLGFLPQSAPVYSELTVDEYLKYCARLRGLGRSETTDSMEYAKERVGIGHYSKRLIGALSGGFRQRVGIAQAILHRPAVVVLDEPTNGLDPVQVSEVRDLIREIAREAVVVVSTHILQEVDALCDRIMMMSTGKLVFDGSIDEFRELHRSTTLHVSLLTDVSPDDFERIEGLESVTELSAGRYRLQFSKEAERTGDRVSEYVSKNGWGLRELYLENEAWKTCSRSYRSTTRGKVDVGWCDRHCG